MKRLAAVTVTMALLAGCGGSTPAPPTKARQLRQPGPPVVTAPLRVVPAPPNAGPETKADGIVTAAGAQCGRERWDVKTATDAAAGSIDLTPRDTTVAALDALPSTNTGPDAPRDNAVESRVYRVTATLDAVKQEADSDFHLALSDGQGHTMIAEIPAAPACTQPPVAGRVSALERQIEAARAAFVQEFGQPSPAGFTAIGHQVTITGVGFYDRIHGQRNVAPNGLELHPLLSIQDP